MVGGYKVSWKARYVGDITQVYIGLNSADKVHAGTSTLTSEIKLVIAKTYNVKAEAITLTEVKVGRKKINLAKLDSFRGVDMPL
jgi:hypothetical protein